MTGAVAALLGLAAWFVLALLSLAVVACAGRAGRHEDVRKGYAESDPVEAPPATSAWERAS